MTLPSADTVVHYADGELENDATVLHAERLADGRWAIILDETSCHPVDARWPDQGADRALLRRSTVENTQQASAKTSGAAPKGAVVTDAVVGATDGTALFVGADVPVRPGTDAWAFVVAHLIEEPLAEGDAVTVVVDANHRRALSIGHTGCHLASLALNRALADRWSREVRRDGLGRPDFDGVAIESSRIRQNGSTDVFRLNKSLRRKGFTAEGLADALPAITGSVEATLAAWTASAARVHVDRDGPGLTDRRYWVCELPEASVRIACGGTHVTSLADLGNLAVTLEITVEDGTPSLIMTTDAR